MKSLLRGGVLACFIALLFSGCSSSKPAPAGPQQGQQPATRPPATNEPALGIVRVDANVLNVRSEPNTTSMILARLKRGDRLTVVSVGNDWMQIELPGGGRGWVSAQYVRSADMPASRHVQGKKREGCVPDSDFAFERAPQPSFSENGPHGLVIVEGTVNAQGTVTSTHVISNTTGSTACAGTAEQELKGAKFLPPVRNCTPRAFIFTYTRTF